MRDKNRIMAEINENFFKCYKMFDDPDFSLHAQGTMDELEDYANRHPGVYFIYEYCALKTYDGKDFVWDRYGHVKNINTMDNPI